MAAREFYSGAKEDSLTQGDSLLNAYYLLLNGNETGELVNIMSDFPAFPVGDSSSTYAEQMDSLAAYQACKVTSAPGSEVFLPRIPFRLWIIILLIWLT